MQRRYPRINYRLQNSGVWPQLYAVWHREIIQSRMYLRRMHQRRKGLS